MLVAISRKVSVLVVVISLLISKCGLGENIEDSANLVKQPGPSAADYSSIQSAIDANPGQMIFVPQGEHYLDSPLNISSSGCGLYGYGVIIQRKRGASILTIANAQDVRIESLTFKRNLEQGTAPANGIVVRESRSVVLDRIRIRDNKSQGNAIMIDHSTDCSVINSEVLNYKQVAIDDRTGSELYGYAFNCIDGSGIYVRGSTDTKICGNRIVENEVFPTQEFAEKHSLGNLVSGKHPTKLGQIGMRSVSAEKTVDHWHQGSAIVVTDPVLSRRTIVTNNHIENCAQGIDLHCDDVICSQNIISNCTIGLKATHGAKNLILEGNVISAADRWGIVFNPGAASHYGNVTSNQKSKQLPNVDGGTIVSNNIITNYGEGDEYWHLGGGSKDLGSSFAIAILAAQLPTNPPLRDILFQGNIVYDSKRDSGTVSKDNADGSPKYRYAVYIESQEDRPPPRGLRFRHNLFHTGTDGVTNVEALP